ncbi:MAG: helix-turn-helix domain-containing protein [Chloroflexi bacterium]|nr:helix-turn-helix domain-containing protein [Chloroflexota bacterium]
MPGSNPIQSLSRGLQILEWVAGSDDGLTLQQLAERMQLQPSTAHSLAKTLVLRGFLERASSPVRYQLGPGVINLVDQYRDRPFQRRAAQVLGRLYEECPAGARLVLAEPVGVDVVLTLRISPERPGVLEHPSYSALPVYTTACGLAFLAFWPHERRLLSHRSYPFDQYGAHTWGAEERLEAFLSRVREQGHACAPVGPNGLCCLAVPIFSPTRGLVAALGLAVPMRDEAWLEPYMRATVPRLKAAAREIATGEVAS